MKNGLNLLGVGLALVILGIVVQAVVGGPPLGVFLALLGIAVTFVGTMARMRAQRSESFDDAVRPEERVHLNRLQRLSAEIEAYTKPERAGQSPTLRVIAVEASQEAKSIVAQAAKMLSAKDELRKLANGRYEAQRALWEIEGRLKEASDAERPALESARESRSAQVRQYDTVDAKITQVEASLGQAELALGDIKARLAVAAAAEASTDQEGLRESLARVKALNQSFDEAQQMMEELK